jgi:hypothetical protein
VAAPAMKRSIFLRFRPGVRTTGVHLGEPATRDAVHRRSDRRARETNYFPVTFENCGHVKGPFFHGTTTSFHAGDLLVPGRLSNDHEGRPLEPRLLGCPA